MWRRVPDTAVHSVRVRLAPPLPTNQFGDVLSVAAQLQVEARRRLERLSRRVLHGVNLPTATDSRRIEDQLVAIERRLHDLSKVVHDLDADRGRPN
jgi:hypothetical protein